MSIGKVDVWYMTEEERQAYIEKHPIKPQKRPKGASFSSLSDGELTKEKRKRRWGSTGYRDQ
jgi:hypothetical protein